MHDGGANGLCAQGIPIRAPGNFHFRYGGKRVVDDQVCDSRLSILAGMAVYMRTLSPRVAAAIYGSSHQPVPEQNSKVIRARLKAAMLQEPVIGGGQRVVEDHTIGDCGEATQLIERAQHIQIG